MFKPLLQGEILHRIVSLWQPLMCQMQGGEQVLLKAAQIFLSVTTDSFSERKQRGFFLNLVMESIEVVTGHLIVAK